MAPDRFILKDISRAFIAALEAPADQVFNEAFNVGQTTTIIAFETWPRSSPVSCHCTVEFADDASPTNGRTA